ncbi:transporter substrate-binding domain-containing protein [Duganella sp. FT92W]|uniref:Transporter substrate-binding domain-containing protein n=1 Tax=Pseudoduganella rivuli TaxID=2666085 RepID=A0A7X2LS49_9BURK|nr:transporter substrate-binding domain-containing protein [Pseudoduganella rivuli]MRV73140.1 transporter substrate-binding domain-containing protein [Pseudoduganella rivuli]
MYLRRALLAILVWGSTVSAAYAGPAAARVFVVGVENLQYYPLHTVDRHNEYAGFAREVLDAFARRHGYTFRYVPLPINRLYASLLKEHTVDFKYPDNPKWREELRAGATISYSDVVVTTEEGAMVLPQHRGRPLAQLKTLGTALGFTPWPYQDAIDSKTITLTTSSGFDSLLRLALAGHIDAVYVNVDVANHMLEDQLKTPGGLQFDPGLPHARSDFRMSTVRHPEIVQQFSQFLQQERNWLQQLRGRYKIGNGNGAPPR